MGEFECGRVWTWASLDVDEIKRAEFGLGQVGT